MATTARKYESLLEFINIILTVAHMSGVSFVEKQEDANGKAKYSVKFKGTGKVYSDLIKYNCNNIIAFIKKANSRKKGIKIRDAGKDFFVDGDEIMFIMEEIPVNEREVVYPLMDTQAANDEEEFINALAMIMVKKTKRMKFLRIWLEDIKPIITDVSLVIASGFVTMIQQIKKGLTPSRATKRWLKELTLENNESINARRQRTKQLNEQLRNGNIFQKIRSMYTRR